MKARTANVSHSDRRFLRITLTPALTIILITGVLPLIILIGFSFVEWELGYPLSRMRFVGLQNYRWFFTNAQSRTSLAVSGTFVLVVVTVETVLGFLIARLASGRSSLGSRLLTVAMIVPISMTPSVTALMWRLYFTPSHGIINWILDSLFGLFPNWFSGSLALPMLCIVDAWRWTPFMALIFLAGLQSIPRDPIESASIDGANSFQTLVHVVVPMMRPVIVVALILRIIDSLKLFDLVFPLTEGGPGNATEVLPMHVYRYGFKNGQLGRASAIAVFLFSVVLAMSALYIRASKQDEE